MEKVDLISNLPTTILHDILSRLPKKYAIRTSVLSKSWAETWSTFPILSFSDTKILGMEGNDFIDLENCLNNRKKFIDYVDKRLLTFCNQGLAIKQFTLKPDYFDLHSLSKELDLWLKFASESGVRVIKLSEPFDTDIYKEDEDEDEDEEEEEPEKEVKFLRYILPISVFKPNSLTKLVLHGRIGVDLSFIKYSTKFFSLQVLSIEDVVFSDKEALQHLISHCPKIEYITLYHCYVLNPGSEWNLYKSPKSQINSLCMCGLARLNGVDVGYIQEVCVDSPCLENLRYFGGVMEVPYKIHFDKCRNLRRLNLWLTKSTIITNKWFLECFSKFPYLESLKLSGCQMSERITISSVQLKELHLLQCSIEKEVSIDAPNLLLCKCEYQWPHDENPVSFLRCSSQLKVKVEYCISNLKFGVLRELINNFNPRTFLTSFTLRIFSIRDAVPLHPLTLPPIIKRLNLHVIPKDESTYFPFIYQLLLSCCTTTISMELSSYCPRAFIEFFYETLMGKNKDSCYCHSGDTKCWWHNLKSVKVSSSIEMDKNVDLNTILDLMQNREKITFSLEF